MKKTIICAAFTMAALAGFAQTDTTTVTITRSSDPNAEPDTVRVGSMIIIKKGDFSDKHRKVEYHKKKKNSRVQTSWLLLDLGFSNFEDKTNYASAEALTFTGGTPNSHISGNDFDLRNGKSFNINIWIFRQQYGITRDNVLNLSYGLMIENNNYRFENNISFRNYGNGRYVGFDSINFSKNKLATSYFTIPVMLGFNTNPRSGHGFNAAAGVSIGYLYSSRNKQISDERGKQKIKSNFNMEPWKLQFVGEVGLGGLRVYGSYSPNSMFKSGLDMRPYNIGLRIGGWN